MQHEIEKIHHEKDESGAWLSTVKNYIDDILIGGKTYESYRQAIIAFFNMLRRLNMKYSLEKSEWGKKEVSYLGFKISPDTWYPDPARIEALVNKPPPSNLKELRGFIASLSFYNQWLPFIQHTIEPLLEKLRNLDKSLKGKQRKGAPINLEYTAREAFV